MTETHDVALEGGGHDFRVRVYPAHGAERRAAGVAARRRLHVRHARDARSRPGRPAPERGRHHRGLGRLHARAPGRARGARPARPRRRLPVARAAPRRDGGRRPPGAVPGREPADRRRLRLGRRERRQRTARTPSAWRWAARAPAPTCPPAPRCDCATAARRRPGVLALVYPSLHDGILTPNDETAELLRRRPARPGCSRPRAATRSTATTCPTGHDPARLRLRGRP